MQFEELYHSYKDIVYNLCLNYLYNVEDAEEATQDIFVKIHKKQGSFQGKSSWKTWIYRITTNHCLDVIKAKKRKKRFAKITSIFFPDSNQIRHDITTINHPGILLEQKEAVAVIFECMDLLPERQRTILILAKIDQLPMKEVCEIMALNIKGAESLLYRAKQSLKKHYDKRRG